MALQGELSGLNGVVCCGKTLVLQVCRSAAGFYLGYICASCGPISRETGYYATRKIAEANLAKDVPDKLRTTVPGDRNIFEWNPQL